ncbi:MAG: dihydropteroate synthase [Desulfobacteraceae bacterium]|nr:dihydropteroate synthase [Desulfobacteraceae bacterium]
MMLKESNHAGRAALTVCDRKIFTIGLRDKTLELGRRTLIMGIVNITPDSFSDGGRYFDFERARAHAFELLDQGADILDIGGESTRPGSESVPQDVELQRVIPLIRAIREKSDIPVSVDTNKAAVAREAISAGADIINDISSLRFDPDMARVAADTGAPLVLMHMLGVPKTMQKAPSYASLFSEIIAFLEERIRFAVASGVEREQIIIDPGIGFGKTVAHNLAIIRDLGAFGLLDRPILLGVSRKRFIGAVLNREEGERELGTAVANCFGIAGGAHILRTHEVAFHREASKMADAVRDGIAYRERSV